MNLNIIRITIFSTTAAFIILAAGCDNFFNDVAEKPIKIVFTSNRAGGVEIFTMNADGSEQTQITFGGAMNQKPRWSPDGAKIAFSRGGSIYIMNADGSDQSKLTTGISDSSPSWSPDGKQMICSSGIMLALVDIASKTTIAAPTIGTTPHWSPRSGKIAYMTGNNIYTMYSDGTGFFSVTTAGNNITPFWSPDGSQIVFAKNVSGIFQIHIINADRTDETQLTYFSINDQDSPSMSADGEHIVFRRLVSGIWQIHIMDADGSNIRQLTFVGDNTEPCFSPQ